ncbi:MAG: hypothetical protein A2951_01775 [Candidatus Buchananbacteria bacterium RIFCSPLOWO2_01_FULL_56_15]|uniref:Four helix bundle protein n=2 Tax=Candidatus Buchananiibacteriota TaxID=1817903 RepID=A0A1G1YJ77_9BACT|nr:MAG: hypothetical protein A3J59_03505 [Candidatus Buchananbacteria bacterium RIFCSPHIGHO2_02_FULL_56_16]OGY55251.1 MAG: hypothetical protein A2951_01775 [Candidatus Buchananbacteria bacterium RIFCSPLOWO2_01_FULL_56_15]
MTQIQSSKRYDLEERTYRFAHACKNFCHELPHQTANFEYIKQLVRSSASVAANYIEANESMSRKDFSHRVKICRKEAKESCLWLRLCDIDEDNYLAGQRQRLFQEATELTKIFGSIVGKCK